MNYALPLAAVAALMLAACEPTGAEDAAAPADAPATEDAATDAGSDAGAEAEATPALALDGEGLRLVNPETGSTRLIPFGGAQAETLAALSGALGAPSETGSNAECPPGPLDFATFGQDTTLYFQDGAFAGWFTRAGDWSTMNGIRAGMTRAELDASGSEIELTETSLGQEFDAGGVYGVMNEDASAVEVLWTGANCFAR
jgi:hypothetical protein